MNDSGIEKQVTKSIAEVINGFLQKIVLFLKVFANLSFLYRNNKFPIKVLLFIFYLYHVFRLVENTEKNYDGLFEKYGSFYIENTSWEYIKGDLSKSKT